MIGRELPHLDVSRIYGLVRASRIGTERMVGGPLG